MKSLFQGHDLVALIVAVSFAAGLNVYATVATLGLLAHADVLALPPQLQLLGNWWIIAVSSALFGVEFFADKIPAFDLFWNALHTFIRIPVAALLAWRATAHLSPGEQLIATLAGGLVAAAAHAGKTSARAIITPSPEPFSNIALSVGEDGASIGLTWLATQHPLIAGSIAATIVVVIVLLARWVVRAIKRMFRRGRQAGQTGRSEIVA